MHYYLNIAIKTKWRKKEKKKKVAYSESCFSEDCVWFAVW